MSNECPVKPGTVERRPTRCRLRADIHEHETAGAVSILGQAALETILAEECRLLIARDARDLDRTAEKVRRGFRIDLARRAHLGSRSGYAILDRRRMEADLVLEEVPT